MRLDERFARRAPTEIVIVVLRDRNITCLRVIPQPFEDAPRQLLSHFRVAQAKLARNPLPVPFGKPFRMGRKILVPGEQRHVFTEGVDAAEQLLRTAPFDRIHNSVSVIPGTGGKARVVPDEVVTGRPDFERRSISQVNLRQFELFPLRNVRGVSRPEADSELLLQQFVNGVERTARPIPGQIQIAAGALQPDLVRLQPLPVRNPERRGGFRRLADENRRTGRGGDNRQFRSRNLFQK